jgi:hypothetical protein
MITISYDRRKKAGLLFEVVDKLDYLAKAITRFNAVLQKENLTALFNNKVRSDDVLGLFKGAECLESISRGVGEQLVLQAFFVLPVCLVLRSVKGEAIDAKSLVSNQVVVVTESAGLKREKVWNS